MSEEDRIKEAYAARDSGGKRQLYGPFAPASLYSMHRREKQTVALLKQHVGTDLAGKKILDVGCGDGGELRRYISYGALPEDLHGVDLLESRIEAAKVKNPGMDFHQCNAADLPYKDSFFDIVMCYMVFSSVLDDGMRKSIAAEMQRVLKPGGIVIWYDFHMNNPSNPDVRGMKLGDIQALFAGYEISMKKVTLAPPLARRLVTLSEPLCIFLENLSLFNSHYLGVIRKK